MICRTSAVEFLFGLIQQEEDDEIDGKPFGGTYFGTQEQMRGIAKMDLRYFLDK